MNKTNVRFARIILYTVLFSVFVLMFKAFDASTGGEFLAPPMYATMEMIFLSIIILSMAVYFWFGQTKIDKTIRKVKKNLNHLR